MENSILERHIFEIKETNLLFGKTTLKQTKDYKNKWKSTKGRDKFSGISKVNNKKKPFFCKKKKNEKY